MLYSKLHIFLHWLSAVVIVWALVSGFYIAVVEVSPAIKEAVTFFNVSITTVFVPFFLVRIALCIFRIRDDWGCLDSPMSWAVFVIHKLIYLVTIIVLATGVLMMKQAINVFDVFVLPEPLDDLELIECFIKVHVMSCVVLALLVAVHVGAVIKHECRGHRIVRRMRW